MRFILRIVGRTFRYYMLKNFYKPLKRSLAHSLYSFGRRDGIFCDTAPTIEGVIFGNTSGIYYYKMCYIEIHVLVIII